MCSHTAEPKARARHPRSTTQGGPAEGPGGPLLPNEWSLRDLGGHFQSTGLRGPQLGVLSLQFGR